MKSNTGPPNGMQMQMHCLDSQERSREAEEAEEINKFQVAGVPVDARLIREATAQDPILSRALHLLFMGGLNNTNFPTI